jgi:hypothetical protein
MMPELVHMMIFIAPRNAMIQMVGFPASKRAIHLAREPAEWTRVLARQHFQAEGYFSTVGHYDVGTRVSIHQQEEDSRFEPLNLWR